MNNSFITGERHKAKIIGKVFVEQMKLEDDERWILQRISPICENCNKNRFYNIYKTRKFNIVFKFFTVDVIYTIVCPECGETIELEVDEFSILKPFISINTKLEDGKISEVEYRNENSKIINKLKKKSL